MVSRRTLFHFRRRFGRGSVSKTPLSPALLTLIDSVGIVFKWVDGFRKVNGRMIIKRDKFAPRKSTDALPLTRNVSLWKNVMKLLRLKNGNGRNFIFNVVNQRIRDRSANKNLVFLLTPLVIILFIVGTLRSRSVSFLFGFFFSFLRANRSLSYLFLLQ